MSAEDEAQALDSIQIAEKRLAALQELGCDVAALRSQLAFARTRLHDGRAGEVPALCEDVLATARRLAEGAGGEGKPRTGRFTRDQLGTAVHDLLSQGLFAKLLSEQRAGPDPRLEARFAALRTELTTHCDEAVERIRTEQESLRAELTRFRHELSASTTVGSDEPAWATRLHESLAQAIAVGSAVPQRLADLLADKVQPSAAVVKAPTPVVEVVDSGRQPIVDALYALGERLDALVTASTSAPAVPQSGGLVPGLPLVLEEATTKRFHATSTRTERSATDIAPPLDTDRIRRLVAEEVSQQLGDQQTSPDAEPLMVFDPDQVRSLVVQEIERRLPAAAAVTGPVDPARQLAELKQHLLRLLPETLRDRQVQQSLFALLALEAVIHPGALGELTGLRAFLRRELKLVAGELSGTLQVV